ncbi:MAG: hypothetical protein JSS36_11465 [Proteobacteria bacterium]|nr:hypothetical protein [Pseudomonadota bacterium]
MLPGLALGLVAALGFANQRGSTCAVAAADDIVLHRRFDRLAGFALAAALSGAWLAAVGAAPRQAAAFGLASLAGGALGACGAALNGRCAMGTIASLCRGRLDRLATLAGFLLGARAMLAALGAQAAATAAVVPAHSPWGAALAGAIALGAWYLARRHGAPSPGWMALIGLANGVLLWAMVDWSYTAWLTRLAAGRMAELGRFGPFFATLVGGSLLASALAGSWQARWGTARAWLRSGLGGALLGAGSACVPGSNDAMLLVGVPLLVPGLLGAYASFWAVLLALRGLRWRHGD